MKRLDNKRRELEMKRRKVCRGEGLIIGLIAGYALGRYVVPKVKESCCDMNLSDDIENIKMKTNDILSHIKGQNPDDFYEEDEIIVDEELMDELAEELLDEMMDELEEEVIDDVVEEALENAEEEAIDELIDAAYEEEAEEENK